MAGAALLAAALGVGWLALRPAAPGSPPPVPDVSARLLGVWEAPVRYAWSDRHPERFEFVRHAGELTATASFLTYPRALENLRVDGLNLHFQTRSSSSTNNETRALTRSYLAELRGQPPDEVLALRMQSSGEHRIFASSEESVASCLWRSPTPSSRSLAASTVFIRSAPASPHCTRR